MTNVIGIFSGKPKPIPAYLPNEWSNEAINLIDNAWREIHKDVATKSGLLEALSVIGDLVLNLTLTAEEWVIINTVTDDEMLEHWERNLTHEEYRDYQSHLKSHNTASSEVDL